LRLWRECFELIVIRIEILFIVLEVFGVLGLLVRRGTRLLLPHESLLFIHGSLFQMRPHSGLAS
jgi:hypothetical protein